MVVADPADCTFQFDPVGKATFKTSCDVAKTLPGQERRPVHQRGGCRRARSPR